MIRLWSDHDQSRASAEGFAVVSGQWVTRPRAERVHGD